MSMEDRSRTIYNLPTLPPNPRILPLDSRWMGSLGPHARCDKNSACFSSMHAPRNASILARERSVEVEPLMEYCRWGKWVDLFGHHGAWTNVQFSAIGNATSIRMKGQ
jgi:hypothetical protein